MGEKMKRIMGLLLCGYALTAYALTSSEMDQGIANQTAIPVTKVKTTLDLFEAKLKSEAASGKAVKLDGLGTLNPRQISGTRTGRTIGGGSVTYPNWKLVKNPEVKLDADLYSADMGVSQDEYNSILSNYKNNIKSTLRKGGTVSMAGFGSYKLAKKKATKNLPARRVAGFHSTPKGMHQKFTPEWTP